MINRAFQNSPDAIELSPWDADYKHSELCDCAACAVSLETTYETTIRIIEEFEQGSSSRLREKCSDGDWSRDGSRRLSNSETLLRMFQSVCSLARVVR